MIRCEQGRAHELIALVREFSSDVSGTQIESIARAFEARLCFEGGDVGAAESMLDAEAAEGFVAGRRDGNWHPYHAHWAELTAELQNRDAAEVLRDSLLPFVHLIANFQPVAFGAVSRFIGRLELVLGRYGDAETHLAEAAARHEELGATLYLARTWADQSELLALRDGGDSARVREFARCGTRRSHTNEVQWASSSTSIGSSSARVREDRAGRSGRHWRSLRPH